jgi:hypothetical protein
MSAAVPGGAIGLGDVAGQFACARDLARVLDSTHELVNEMAGALTRAVDLDLSSGGTTTTDLRAPAAGYLAHARQLARSVDLASVRAGLAGTLAMASDLDPFSTRQLAAVLSQARASVSQVAGQLAQAHASVRTMRLSSLRAWALDLNSDSCGDVGIDLTGARTSARALRRDLDKARIKLQLRARTTSAGHAAKHVAPSAVGLLVTAARLLPAADRVRYVEEYQSELQDLAQAGTGRIGQVQYGARQLWHALPMSIALRSLRHTGAAP